MIITGQRFGWKIFKEYREQKNKKNLPLICDQYFITNFQTNMSES